MANEEQLSILKQGPKVWNKWRFANIDAEVDFQDADLREANLELAYLIQADFGSAILSKASLKHATLSEACLRWTDLNGANLEGADCRSADLLYADLIEAHLANADFSVANLVRANLTAANLAGSTLIGANLGRANLSMANLQFADFGSANLVNADLTGADLTGANLTGANLRGAEVHKAKISGSSVHAINVWDLHGEFEEQKDLVITPPWETTVTVDNIKVAQFMYLILNNEELRGVIDTLTAKSVLILGRFAIAERKAILDELRDKLREYDLLPIVFDFDRPIDKDFTETIKTLAGLSYFVIADITNPKSSPLELQATVPDYQIPFVPIIQEGESPFAMMVDLQKKYDWVLPTRTYSSKETLIKALKKGIIEPAMHKHNELRLIKAQRPDTVSLDHFDDEN